MARIIPRISGGALGPILDWMAANDGQAAARLAARDLSWLPGHRAAHPVPLLPALSLLVDLMRAHGPDVPCRMARARGIVQIGPLGAQSRAAGTVGGAVRAVAAAMACHCTHEMITVETDRGDLVIRDLWSLGFDDDDTAHAVQQYVAAVFASLFRSAPGQPPPRVRVAIRPHPDMGIAHLGPWFGASLVRSTLGPLLLTVPSAPAARPLDPCKRPRPAAMADWPRLRTDDTLSESVRHLLRSMLGSETLTIDRLVGYSGMSRRSLQRRLSDEGTSFSALLDEARHHLAMDRVGRAEEALSALSSDLGYAGQASLSRAFCRWTGAPPSRFGRS